MFLLKYSFKNILFVKYYLLQMNTSKYIFKGHFEKVSGYKFF